MFEVFVPSLYFERVSVAEDNKEQYVVLARKYRPQVFEDLLGQDALVRTLKNAIENNRLHHAYILTGIRGVGKTTTARLIARALNCTGLDGKGGPTIHPCGVCENCQAIAAGRHIDVLELDAASRTGVDDMRELLSGVQYKPTNARYKVYIIDEVHMLSKGAFNALLKTLEEPPAHVKFIFATTEIRKVPVTILSRCQRFDLERLSVETLITLFEKILTKENVSFDKEAILNIAKAADGSARDGLSMLDQAIVLGNNKISLDIVSQMIGLADRGEVLELFENLVFGQMDKALANIDRQYQKGSDPLSILKDLIDITHMLTKAKVVPTFIESNFLAETEKQLLEKLSKGTSIAILSKIWQMLIKGLNEVSSAPFSKDALEMVLIRIAYSAALPTPAEILEEIKKKPLINNTPVINKPTLKKTIEEENDSAAEQASEILENDSQTKTLADLISYLEEHKKLLLLYSLKHDVCVKEFDDGFIKISVSEKISPDFIANLKNALKEAFQKPWNVEVEYGLTGETLADKEEKEKQEDKRQISEHPLIKAILSEFKGAKFETLLRQKVSDTDEDVEENEQFINNFEEED